MNIGTGVETSLSQLCGLLLCLSASSLAPEHVEARQVNNVLRRRAAVEKAEKLLGFRAQTNLEAGLRELIRWRAAAKALSPLSHRVTEAVVE
jgi:UDP-glucose 4-epimerase